MRLFVSFEVVAAAEASDDDVESCCLPPTIDFEKYGSTITSSGEDPLIAFVGIWYFLGSSISLMLVGSPPPPPLLHIVKAHIPSEELGRETCVSIAEVSTANASISLSSGEATEAAALLGVEDAGG